MLVSCFREDLWVENYIQVDLTGFSGAGSSMECCTKALRETGGGNIDIRVTKLDGMDFSYVNGLPCITSENQLI